MHMCVRIRTFANMHPYPANDGITDDYTPYTRMASVRPYRRKTSLQLFGGLKSHDRTTQNAKGRHWMDYDGLKLTVLIIGIKEAGRRRRRRGVELS